MTRPGLTVSVQPLTVEFTWKAYESCLVPGHEEISGDFQTSVLGNPHFFFLIIQLNFKSAVELERHLRKTLILNSLLSSTHIKHAKGIKITK